MSPWIMAGFDFAIGAFLIWLVTQHERRSIRLITMILAVVSLALGLMQIGLAVGGITRSPFFLYW